MKLSKLEQESIILYNEEESTASIYTHDPKLKRKLKRRLCRCLFCTEAALDRRHTDRCRDRNDRFFGFKLADGIENVEFGI